MDLIGKIYLASSQQHYFIIVATDYFTKWVEAKPVKSTTSQEIITFIEEHIIQRFGIPESITTDKGSSFVSGEMLDMAEAFKFRLLQSTPYYAQANGQTESSNKVIINIIRKMLEKNPKEHMIHIKITYPKFRKRTKWLQDKHNSTFIQWLHFKVRSELNEEEHNGVSENLRWLAAGPSMAVPSYRSYLINDVKFNTKAQDDV
ncbi:unnamed protein product [Prunus armeniaca]